MLLALPRQLELICTSKLVPESAFQDMGYRFLRCRTCDAFDYYFDTGQRVQGCDRALVSGKM